MAATIRFGPVRAAASGTAVGLLLVGKAAGAAHPSTSMTRMTRARRYLLAIGHHPSGLADVQKHAIRVIQAKLPAATASQQLHTACALVLGLGEDGEQLRAAFHQLVQI